MAWPTDFTIPADYCNAEGSYDLDGARRFELTAFNNYLLNGLQPKFVCGADFLDGVGSPIITNEDDIYAFDGDTTHLFAALESNDYPDAATILVWHSTDPMTNELHKVVNYPDASWSIGSAALGAECSLAVAAGLGDPHAVLMINNGTDHKVIIFEKAEGAANAGEVDIDMTGIDTIEAISLAPNGFYIAGTLSLASATPGGANWFVAYYLDNGDLVNQTTFGPDSILIENVDPVDKPPVIRALTYAGSAILVLTVGDFRTVEDGTPLQMNLWVGGPEAAGIVPAELVNNATLDEFEEIVGLEYSFQKSVFWITVRGTKADVSPDPGIYWYAVEVQGETVTTVFVQPPLRMRQRDDKFNTPRQGQFGPTPNHPTTRQYSIRRGTRNTYW